MDPVKIAVQRRSQLLEKIRELDDFIDMCRDLQARRPDLQAEEPSPHRNSAPAPPCWKPEAAASRPTISFETLLAEERKRRTIPDTFFFGEALAARTG